MLKLIIYDDTENRGEWDSFLKNNKESIKLASSSKDLLSKVLQITETIKHNATGKKIVLSTAESIELIDISNIVRCESNRNYTFIYLVDKKKIYISRTLMDFENILSKYHFLRIHKSHLVNINYIEKYVKTDGGYILLTDGSKLPVSIRKKEYLFKEFEKL